MEQNQNTDNDLQKAIDDITNKTNTDPVFADPVAAPSSIPEGDTGELGEPVGPFPEPKPEVVPPAPAPEPAPQTPQEPVLPPAPTPPEPMLDPTALETIETTTSNPELNVHQIKEAALRDLIPLLDKLNATPSQKFNIYRDIFEELRDYTVLEPAYRIAKEISDETERAAALLYLVEAIDKM